jgi:hypothetical protein
MYRICVDGIECYDRYSFRAALRFFISTVEKSLNSEVEMYYLPYKKESILSFYGLDESLYKHLSNYFVVTKEGYRKFKYFHEALSFFKDVVESNIFENVSITYGNPETDRYSIIARYGGILVKMRGYNK